MDCYKIIWKKSALKELKVLDKHIIGKIIEQIKTLKLNPRPRGNKKQIIEIIRVGHRKKYLSERTELAP